MRRVTEQRRARHTALALAVGLFALLLLLDVGVTVWSALWGAGLDDAATSHSAMLAVSDLRELLNDMVKVVGGILLGAFAYASWPGHE